MRETAASAGSGCISARTTRCPCQTSGSASCSPKRSAGWGRRILPAGQRRRLAVPGNACMRRCTMDLAALLPARSTATIWRGCRRRRPPFTARCSPGCSAAKSRSPAAAARPGRYKASIAFEDGRPRAVLRQGDPRPLPGRKPLRCTVIPEYRFTAAQARDTLLCMARSCEGLVAKHRHSSDFQKEKAIHDHIAATVRYRDADAPYSHEAPGALCSGSAFARASPRRSISCGPAGAAVHRGVRRGGRPGGAIGHAWNVVCVGASFTIWTRPSTPRSPAAASATITSTSRTRTSAPRTAGTTRCRRAPGPSASTRKWAAAFSAQGSLRVYPSASARKDHRLQAAAAPARRRGTVADAIQKLLCANLFPGLRAAGRSSCRTTSGSWFSRSTCFERSAFSPRRGPVFPRRAPVPTFSSPFLSGTIIARKQPVQSPARQKEDKK